MASPIFPSVILSSVFPEFTGFDHIGSGSYKSVYRVTAKQNNTVEVLKVVCLPAKGQPEQDDLYEQELGRIRRETTILGKCSSPYVVKLGSFAPQIVNIEGHACFAYTEEFLQDGTLNKLIYTNNQRGQKPSEEEVKKLLLCLISAVQNLWEQLRVVHRDIKPGNIFVVTNNPERPYVLFDLGIAYDVTAPGLTLRKTDIPHTPLYVAPEMLNANFRDTISYRSDLYSSALSTYEFAAGVHPLRKTADDLKKTYTRVLTQEPAPLETQRSDLSRSLCRLIDQLLKKSPPLRPANMPVLLNQLR